MNLQKSTKVKTDVNPFPYFNRNGINRSPF